MALDAITRCLTPNSRRVFVPKPDPLLPWRLKARRQSRPSRLGAIMSDAVGRSHSPFTRRPDGNGGPDAQQTDEAGALSDALAQLGFGADTSNDSLPPVPNSPGIPTLEEPRELLRKAVAAGWAS